MKRYLYTISMLNVSTPLNDITSNALLFQHISRIVNERKRANKQVSVYFFGVEWLYNSKINFKNYPCSWSLFICNLMLLICIILWHHHEWNKEEKQIGRQQHNATFDSDAIDDESDAFDDEISCKEKTQTHKWKVSLIRCNELNNDK